VFLITFNFGSYLCNITSTSHGAEIEHYHVITLLNGQRIINDIQSEHKRTYIKITI
jgi:hypothetical protein